jgi:hypothetical protein
LAIFEEKERNMSTSGATDRRRFGVIETRYQQHGKIAMYNLTINGKLWACVEWSASRRGRKGSHNRILFFEMAVPTDHLQ